MRTVRGIATTYGIAFTLATAGFGIAVYLVTEVQIEDRLDSRLAAEARALLGREGAAVPVDLLAHRMGTFRTFVGRRSGDSCGAPPAPRRYSRKPCTTRIGKRRLSG